MNVDISATGSEAGRKAAAAGAARIRDALGERGHAFVILATGASQFDMLDHLVQASGIDWSRVTAFHLDEYIGIRMAHPASFRRYLKERFVDRLSSPIGCFHYIDADGDAAAECERLNGLIAEVAIDVAFIGIGENAHLAFNDPPADFEAEAPYVVVELDEACRRQQWGEGWFGSLAEVPRRAISMSVPQIMRSISIVCTVPGERKANAVRGALEGPVTPDIPASILQRHAGCSLFLDSAAAAKLKNVAI